MEDARNNLQDSLVEYAKETLRDIKTAGQFCENFPEWKNARKEEMERLEEIKTSHVTKAERGRKACKEYMVDKLSVWCECDKRHKMLEEELTNVLTQTRCSLRRLKVFLEAVEKLAVTSTHVFQEENQVLRLPDGVSHDHVQEIIAAARQTCPLLLVFKRDPSTFFRPELDNVEILVNQLNSYIMATQKICGELETRQFPHEIQEEDIAVLTRTLTDEDVQRMLDHIKHLTKIRNDRDFRQVFLFKDVSCSGFTDEFTQRKPRMKTSLADMAETADKLNCVNKWTKIARIFGSLVAAVGGVLSIIGYAEIPEKVRVPLGFTLIGMIMSSISGVVSIFTTAVEIWVNHKQQKKAREVLLGLMEDVQHVNDTMKEAASKKAESEVNDVVVSSRHLVQITWKVRSVLYTFKSLFDAVADIVLESINEVTDAVNNDSLDASSLAANVTEIRRLASKEPRPRSKFSKVASIGLNVIFLLCDVFIVFKESISLYKDNETDFSKFLRARAALWQSELDAWEKIHNSVTTGLKTSENDESVLNSHFYIERARSVKERIQKIQKRSLQFKEVNFEISDKRRSKAAKSWETKM